MVKLTIKVKVKTKAREQLKVELLEQKLKADYLTVLAMLLDTKLLPYIYLLWRVKAALPISTEHYY